MHLLRQVQDLPRQIQQLLVLRLLGSHQLVLMVRKDLSLHVGTVLTDHHERRQEDRLQ